MQRRTPAFTLIELMVVVLIMGLLLSAVSLSISRGRLASRDARRLADVGGYARAIDQYVAVNRRYPSNGSPARSMCAHAITGLDASQFLKGENPKDPAPVNASSANCSDMRDGYAYHTQYARSSGPANIAVSKKVTYALEVGLEEQKGNDENLFVSAVSQGITEPFDRMHSTTGKRYRYLILGSFCDASCYGN